MPRPESGAESDGNSNSSMSYQGAPATAPPRYTLLDAGRSLNQGRAAEAIRLLEALGEILPAVEPVRLRYLATAYGLAGDIEQAFSLIERAERMTVPERGAEEHARAKSMRARLYLRAGAYADAAGLLQECVAACAAGRIVDDVFHFGCLADLARALQHQGEPRAALQTFEQAITLAEGFENARRRASRYAAMARTTLERGDPSTAIYYMQTSVLVSEELRLHQQINATLREAALHSEAGDAERAEECLRRAGALAQQSGR